MAVAGSLLQNYTSDNPQSFSTAFSNGLQSDINAAANTAPTSTNVTLPSSGTSSYQPTPTAGGSSLPIDTSGGGINTNQPSGIGMTAPVAPQGIPQGGNVPPLSTGGGVPSAPVVPNMPTPGAPTQVASTTNGVPPPGTNTGMVSQGGAAPGTMPTPAPQQMAQGANPMYSLTPQTTGVGTTQPLNANYSLMGGLPQNYNALSPAQQFQFPNVQSNPGLTSKIAFGNHEDTATKLAATDQLNHQLTTEQKKKEAEDRINQAASTPQGFSQMANEIARQRDDGSWLKYYAFHRLGLADAAKNEANRLGLNDTWQQSNVDGKNVWIKTNPQGAPIKGYDENGAMTADQLGRALNTKGAETGKALYKTPDGHVISVTSIPGRTGLTYRDDTTNEILPGAPKSMTPFGQQDPVVMSGLKSKQQVEAKMRKINADSLAQGAGEKYSEEQIQGAGNAGFKSATGYNYNPQIHGAASDYSATGGVLPPEGERPEVGAASQNQANVVGSDLSEGLKGKIVSAQRTWDEQNKLYQQSVANGTPGKLANGTPVAKPGTSAHEMGNAIDLPRNLSRAERQELARKGYYQPEGTDSVHWEKVGGETAQPTRTQESKVGAVDPAIESQAQAIYNGEIKAPTGMGANNYRNRAIMDRVMSIAQEQGKPYDAGAFERVNKARTAWSSGAQSKQVQQFDRASAHAQSILPVIDNLNNTNSPIWNRIKNEYEHNVGETAPVDFQTAKQMVGDEIVKTVLGGNSALADRQELQHMFSMANTPAQLKAVVNRSKDLMAAQGTAMERQYSNETRQKDFGEKLGPSGKQILEMGHAADRATERANRNTRSNW